MTPLELEAKRTQLTEAAHVCARMLEQAQRAGDRVSVQALAIAVEHLAKLVQSDSALPYLLDDPLEPEPPRVGVRD
jgi:hypothetical protein